MKAPQAGATDTQIDSASFQMSWSSLSTKDEQQQQQQHWSTVHLISPTPPMNNVWHPG